MFKHACRPRLSEKKDFSVSGVLLEVLTILTATGRITEERFHPCDFYFHSDEMNNRSTRLKSVLNRDLSLARGLGWEFICTVGAALNRRSQGRVL